MKPNKLTTIHTLLALGKSQREIARATGIDRKTFIRAKHPCDRFFANYDQKLTIPELGDDLSRKQGRQSLFAA